MIADLDAVLVQPMSVDTAAFRLLMHYATALLDDHAPTPLDVQRLAVSHLCDLVALAIGATRDAAAVAGGRGVPAARLAAIRADTLANLSQVRLSAKTIAQRQGVSERYVYLLFEQSGLSFARFVTEERLKRAVLLLLDPARRGMRISDIAFAVGFGELTTFNRAFRQRYGDTPRAFRGGNS